VSNGGMVTFLLIDGTEWVEIRIEVVLLTLPGFTVVGPHDARTYA
jgi:hypothetical protein